jgi:hypothetical protein
MSRLALTLLLSLTAAAASAADVAAILARADGYRLAGESVRVETRAVQYKHDDVTAERLYHVYTTGRRSLVLMRSAAERGQKVLMLDDKFWLFLPGSKRPIRITATQKLLGEASTGDIATLAWAADYDGTIVGESPLDGTPALELDLSARSQAASYARIRLWVAADDGRPLQAELYLASGKLAKLARYELGDRDGRLQVLRTHLHDHLQPGRRTVLEVVASEAREIPDKVYNPAYLLRDNLEAW